MRIINFEWSSVIEFYYINKNQEQGTRSRPGFVLITPTPSLTSGSLCLTANFRADFWPNLSYYWFEKKNLFRIVEKMNNFCFVINFLELLKKIFIQYLTADLHCSANLANKSATQEGAFRERLGYEQHEIMWTSCLGQRIIFWFYVKQSESFFII